MITAADLERDLLAFTRTHLAAPEMATSITAKTRLFEERVIDSLKVLELIAFVQSAIGTKIPDSQIVLQNFRTIETIARVFTGEFPTETRSPRSRRRAKTREDKPSTVDLLLSRGEMGLTPDGGLRLDGVGATLYDYFDRTVRGWADALGAEQRDFSDEISLYALEQSGFLAAFPDKLIQSDGIALSPAVCYHHYPTLAQTEISEAGLMVTALGRCHRNEFDATCTHPEERLASFTMREIIAVGAAGFVEEFRSDLIARVRTWVKQLGLDAYVTIANDPFFTTESRGRALMQQLLPLKYELRLRTGQDGRTVAAASFNNHHDHFGRAFSIRMSSGEIANSACVAFGWERWVVAFLNQHGSDESSWPETVRGGRVAATV